MIQHTHLTAWQTHAPWPKRSQIEQDLRLSRGVAAIFADSILSEHLAMRGGTVLHKAHLAPADSLIADAWLAIRNVLRPSRILRTAYRFVPVGLRREETIKVEVNLNESASLYPLVNVELDTLDDDGEHIRAIVRSYDINEMLGTKTRALMQREQGRDLFDLFHAWQLSEAGTTPYPVDGARAMEAFAWYLDKEGTRMDCDETNALLDARLRKAAFRRDMDTLLRPGLPKFDVDEGAEIVRKTYFRHLKP